MHIPGSIQFREARRTWEEAYLKTVKPQPVPVVQKPVVQIKENKMNWLALLEDLIPVIGALVTKHLSTTTSKQIAAVVTAVATAGVTAAAAASTPAPVSTTSAS